jgi:hypothetical protein
LPDGGTLLVDATQEPHPQADRVLLLITPRVVIQEEEEFLQTSFDSALEAHDVAFERRPRPDLEAERQLPAARSRR